MTRRVLHVMDHLGAGGIQTYALNLFRHWQDPEFEHELAALHGPGVNHERFVELGMMPRYAATSKRSLSLPWGLRRIIREVKADIVHVYGVPACLLCEWLRGWLGIPRLVTHLQSTYAKHPGQRYQDVLERLCYWKSDHIIACSRAVTEGLVRRAPVSIFYNGIDVARFLSSEISSEADGGYLPASTPFSRAHTHACLGFPADSFVIGTSGRLVAGKDPFTLLNAFGRLAPQHPQLRLLYVGGGPLLQKLTERAAEAGLAERVHITGFVSPDRVPALLHAMDLFAFPSLREGSPLALAEAMAAGLPVVCGDFPAAAEVIEDGRTGLIFPRKDVGALALAIERCEESPQLCGELAAAGQRHVQEHLSAAAMALQIGQVYREVLSHSAATKRATTG